ncbi:MAG: HD domain-containing protein [Clostridia bacterium]|jgi:putative nucleotidyltransferase with HDIG domain|nr:HD domain-containing protein [Clostridia bacterium]
MIDIIKAQKAFKDYIKSYDIKSGKIAVKIAHIGRVTNISKEIAKKLELSKQDILLAELIGMLHDIGRFEQARIYNTFVDKESINHGQYGVKILFEKNLIRKFIQEDSYDKIIYKAIINHNRPSIEKGLSEKENLHCKIIRDADKVDIYYALTTENIQDTYSCEDMSNDIINKEVVRQFKQEHQIDYSILKNAAETMIAHICYVYDFNYEFALEIVKENDYITKLANKYKFKKEETKKAILEVSEIAKEYIEERLEKKEE